MHAQIHIAINLTTINSHEFARRKGRKWHTAHDFLLPRLEATHEVLYLRRDRALGLAGTLARALGDEDAGTAWQRREEAAGKPLTVILDQAEEAWTRPLTRGGEAEGFALHVACCLSQPG